RHDAETNRGTGSASFGSAELPRGKPGPQQPTRSIPSANPRIARDRLREAPGGFSPHATACSALRVEHLERRGNFRVSALDASSLAVRVTNGCNAPRYKVRSNLTPKNPKGRGSRRLPAEVSLRSLHRVSIHVSPCAPPRKGRT